MKNLLKKIKVIDVIVFFVSIVSLFCAFPVIWYQPYYNIVRVSYAEISDFDSDNEPITINLLRFHYADNTKVDVNIGFAVVVLIFNSFVFYVIIKNILEIKKDEKVKNQ